MLSYRTTDEMYGGLMPRKGYSSVTLPEQVVQVLLNYIQKNRDELEFKYGKRGLKSAVVREAILFWMKEHGLSVVSKEE